jgi:hypothetical protein
MPRSHSKLGQLAIIVLYAIVVWLVYKMPTPTSISQPLPIPELLPIRIRNQAGMGPFRFLSYGLRITIQSTTDLRLKLPVSSRRSVTKPR